MTKYLMPRLNVITPVHFIAVIIFYCAKVIQPTIYIQFKLGTIFVDQPVIIVLETNFGSVGCGCFH